MSSSRAKGLTTNNYFICPLPTNKQLHLFPCSDPSSLKAAPSLSHRCLEPPPPTAPPLTSMASSEPLGVMPGFGDLSFDKSLSPFPFLSISDVSALQHNINSLKGIISNKYKLNLTFMGPCIVIYSYRTTNKMHLFLKLFILVKRSTCFARSFWPSSGTQLHIWQIFQTAAATRC